MVIGEPGVPVPIATVPPAMMLTAPPFTNPLDAPNVPLIGAAVLMSPAKLTLPAAVMLSAPTRKAGKSPTRWSLEPYPLPSR